MNSTIAADNIIQTCCAEISTCVPFSLSLSETGPLFRPTPTPRSIFGELCFRLRRAKLQLSYRNPPFVKITSLPCFRNVNGASRVARRGSLRDGWR
ncbi:hypothetical protein D3C73_1349360 [compost metagenome]